MIVRDPTVLARKIEGIEIIVPVTVLNELERSQDRWPGGLTALLRRAADEKAISITSTSDTTIISPAEGGIGVNDALILSLAVELTKGNDVTQANPDTFLVTTDNLLRVIAEKHGVQTLSPHELEQLLSHPATSTQPLLLAAQKVIKNQFWYLVVSLFCGVLATIGIQYLFANIHKIVPWVSPVAFTVAIAIGGFFVFWCRSRARFLYGILEFGVGIGSVYYNLTHLSNDGGTALDVMKVSAGIYVMVRGLDNIGKRIDAYAIGPWWKRTFPD